MHSILGSVTISDGAAAIFKREWYMQNAFQLFHNLLLVFRLHIKNHESSTSGPEEFATQSSRLPCAGINIIYVAIGYSGRKAAFQHPCLVKQGAKIVQSFW